MLETLVKDLGKYYDDLVSATYEVTSLRHLRIPEIPVLPDGSFDMANWFVLCDRFKARTDEVDRKLSNKDLLAENLDWRLHPLILRTVAEQKEPFVSDGFGCFAMDAWEKLFAMCRFGNCHLILTHRVTLSNLVEQRQIAMEKWESWISDLENLERLRRCLLWERATALALLSKHGVDLPEFRIANPENLPVEIASFDRHLLGLSEHFSEWQSTGTFVGGGFNIANTLKRGKVTLAIGWVKNNCAAELSEQFERVVQACFDCCMQLHAAELSKDPDNVKTARGRCVESIQTILGVFNLIKDSVAESNRIQQLQAALGSTTAATFANELGKLLSTKRGELEAFIAKVPVVPESPSLGIDKFRAQQLTVALSPNLSALFSAEELEKLESSRKAFRDELLSKVEGDLEHMGRELRSMGFPDPRLNHDNWRIVARMVGVDPASFVEDIFESACAFVAAKKLEKQLGNSVDQQSESPEQLALRAVLHGGVAGVVHAAGKVPARDRINAVANEMLDSPECETYFAWRIEDWTKHLETSRATFMQTDAYKIRIKGWQSENRERVSKKTISRKTGD